MVNIGVSGATFVDFIPLKVYQNERFHVRYTLRGSRLSVPPLYRLLFGMFYDTSCGFSAPKFWRGKPTAQRQVTSTGRVNDSSQHLPMWPYVCVYLSASFCSGD